MNTHSIDLIRYCARSRGNSTIYLGTAGSHGNEQLQVTLGKGWEGLTVQVVFHPCKVAVQLPANGVLDVPWEATARPLTALQGRIVFQGFDQDRLVNSTDLAYTVASHSPALGRDEQPYTPGIVEGVLNQMAADKDAILQAAQQTGQAKEAAAASAAAAASSAANAQQSAGAANTSAGQAAASASQAAGSAAAANETLTQVQTAGQEAQQKVKDAETEALGNISAAAPALPAVSAAAAWQSVTAKPDGTGYNLAAMAPIEATIRPTVTGNPAVCKDSTAWAFQGLAIYGKSTQDSTPSPENPVPIISAGEGGSIDLGTTGKNLLDSLNGAKNGEILSASSGDINKNDYTNSDFYLLPCVGKERVLSYVVTHNSGYSLYIKFFDANKQVINTPPYYGGIFCSTGAVEQYSSFAVSPNAVFYAIVGSPKYNCIANNIQLELGSVATAYEPYVSQSLLLSTPSGLPGLPVESGGNYVDGTGQQLVCDVVDYNNLTKTQKTNKYTFNGSETFSDFGASATGYNRWIFKVLDMFPDTGNHGIKKALMCNFFAANAFSEGTENSIACGQQNNVVFITPMTMDELKSFMSQKNAEGNPVEIIYRLATPITTPLSDEEIAAYRALTTYPGTTVVSTAEPVAGIEASYVMDGNKYRESVDKRLAALEAAQTGI